MTYFYHIDTHVNNMLSTGTIIVRSGITFQSVTQITAVKMMIPEIVVAPSDRFLY